MHYTGQVVSDVQGYFSVFGSGPPPICLKEQFFAKDYDPSNTAHELRLGFASEGDMRQLVERVLPQIRSLAR